MLGEEETEEEEWIESKDEFGRDILIPATKFKNVTLDPQRTLAFTQTESASHLQGIGFVIPIKSWPLGFPALLFNLSLI
jgi:hypothetical protein